MTTISGKLLLDSDQKISIKIPISPDNPELIEVPLEEMLEEYIDKQVRIEILPVESRIKKGGI